MSIDNVKIWHCMTNINLAVLSVTAKSPNLNHHQYFQIYGICTICFCIPMWYVVWADQI